MAACLLVCLLFLFLPLAKQDTIDQHLNNVLQTIGKIIGFYDSDFKNLNVDGLFGLRILEGHLASLLHQKDLGQIQDQNVIKSIHALKNKTTDICNRAVVHVKNDGELYYKKMSYLVTKPWDVFDSMHHAVNMTLAWSHATYLNAKKKVKLNEALSDSCITELIGSHKSQGQPCDISSSCADTMSTPGLLGYSITHQILWTMLAQKAGCLDNLEKILQELRRGSLLTLRTELCSNNYIQMIETLGMLPDGIIPPSLQDLFLEQLFVCPSIGFVKFLDINYLTQILAWQLPSGCFGKMKKPAVPPTIELEDLIGRFQDEYIDDTDTINKDTLNSRQSQALPGNVDEKAVKHSKLKEIIMVNKKLTENIASWDMPANNGRMLLVEKVMSDGCLAHKTAVASGALVIYLRYLMDPNAELIFSQKQQLRSVPKAFEKFIVGQKHLESISDHQVPQVSRQKIPNNGQSVNDGVVVINRDTELKNTSKVLKSDFVGKVDVNKIKHPKLLANEDLAYDSNQLAINNNQNAVEDIVIKKPEYDANDGNKEHENVGDINDEDANKYADKDFNNDDDDDENVGENNNDIKRNGEGAINSDNYYENEKDKETNNDFHDANKNEKDHNNEKININNDDEYDGDNGYGENDKENVHPHINARNIGKGRRNYENDDNGYNENDEKVIKQVKDYDDDEEGDDYEYDDENDEMKKRQQQEIKNEANISKNDQFKGVNVQSVDRNVPDTEYILTTTNFIIFSICLLLLLFVYRMFKKRRMRWRLNHKYFHI